MTAPITPAARDSAVIAAPVVPHALRSAGLFVAMSMVLAAGGALATPRMPALVPFMLALGPAAIALGVASFEGRGSLGRLLRSTWRRPRTAHWYLVIGLPVAYALTTVAVGVALGASNGDLFADLFPAALIVPLVVLIPAFAEEIAWRGFAVPRLMTVLSPLEASLVLAVPWTVMHLVLMLPGGINEGAAVWSAVAQICAYSVVLTWVFVGTGGSVLVAALVHAGLNGVVPLMRGIDADTAWAIRGVLAVAIAVAVVALGGFRGTAVSRVPGGVS